MSDHLATVVGRHWFHGRRSTKDESNSIEEKLLKEKPLASGKGIDVYISLVESVLFLRGFEEETSAQHTVVLRGRLHLYITKRTKIKAVTLEFQGKATTRWPKGIPPQRVRFQETDTVIDHTWPFYSPQTVTAASGACADYIELLERLPLGGPAQKDALSRSIHSISQVLGLQRPNRLPWPMCLLSSVPKLEFLSERTAAARRNYRVFEPGIYVYNFELPLDSRLPESIEIGFGRVKYDLEATIERAGAFRADLVGSKEVTLIRTPAEGSLEQFQPIAISRKWKDELHLDITVSGKSIPLDAQIPISCTLTTQAAIQFHWMKVFVTEHTEYFCSDKRVHRMEPVRKILICEKWGDILPTSAFYRSPERAVPVVARTFDQSPAASKVSTEVSIDMLGDQGGDASNPVTELEVLAQLPSCYNMKDHKSARLHSDTTYRNIRIHHWIKILIRLSKPDPADPNKRKDFEIAIRAPFRILSREVTQAVITLPEYSAS